MKYKCANASNSDQECFGCKYYDYVEDLDWNYMEFCHAFNPIAEKNIRFRVNYQKNGKWYFFDVSGCNMDEVRNKSAKMKKTLGIDTTINNCWSEQLDI